MSKNLWLLTEDRLKEVTLKKFFSCSAFNAVINTISIHPIIKDNKFIFTYEVIGISCDEINKIYMKIVSGMSSFVDILVFHQEHEPTINDIPIYAIEETKTDDSVSRNTGVYQRCSKFVFIKYYYPTVQLIMLYNLQVEQKETPTSTYIFGIKMLKTLGVEILGKKDSENVIFNPFNSLDDLIDLKNKMKPPKSGQSILIKKLPDKIEISAKLLNNKGLSDPSIGTVTIMAQCIRNLGWTKDIEITHHQLPNQKILGRRNKFVLIANQLNISLRDLTVPKATMKDGYWKYETDGEKLVTIFIHLLVENFTKGRSIFENHAGCEKGYFITKNGDYIQLKKYNDGDKTQQISIPDNIIVDDERHCITVIEGKKYEFRENGVLDLNGYSLIEKNYIEKYYPDYKINKTVVVYGSTLKEIIDPYVGFLLNVRGRIILNENTPEIFKDAVKNLYTYNGINNIDIFKPPVIFME